MSAPGLRPCLRPGIAAQVLLVTVEAFAADSQARLSKTLERVAMCSAWRQWQAPSAKVASP